MTPQPSFDSLALFYQLLERATFGPCLHWCRTVNLQRLGSRKKALVLGDGDGRFLVDLLKSNFHIQVESIDLSAGMVSEARRRICEIPNAETRVSFVIGDARLIPWSGTGYDLVVTNFFLDCFPTAEIEQMVEKVLLAAAPAVIWLDGDFRLPTARWPRLAARVLLVGMYLAFNLVTGLSVRYLADSGSILGTAFHFYRKKLV